MSASITINDQATPLLKGVDAAIRDGQPVREVMGRAGVDCLRSHFFGLDSSRPNAMGGDRTHFYAQVARGTNFTTLADGVLLAINQVGFRQRLEGGTITPVNAKMLTIPAAPEAYGKRAGEFNDLRFEILAGKPALVQTAQTQFSYGKPRKDGTRNRVTTEVAGGKVMFWLAKSVTQRADPTVLPAEGVLADAVMNATDKYIKRLLERGGNG